MAAHSSPLRPNRRRNTAHTHGRKARERSGVTHLPDLCWSLCDLGQAVSTVHGSQIEPLAPPSNASQLTEWLTWAALRLNSEITSIDIALRDLDSLVISSAPAIYGLEEGYLIVLHAGKQLTVIAPDLSRKHLPARTLAAALRAPFESDHRATYQSVVAECSLTPSRQQSALAALLKHQTAPRRFRSCWIIALPSQVKLWRPIPQLITAHAAQYLLWLASWAVLGSLSFSGHLDRGWLTAWGLLLLTLIPFRLLTTWTQGTFAVGLGAMLKRRLLQGALRLEPEEVRSGGVGTFLGQALEAEAIETLAISGGIAGLLALIEMLPAMFVLGRFAIALALWLALGFFAALCFFRRYKGWTGKRMELTRHLVEVMVGHRTRLAQQPQSEWHSAEDSSLSGYLHTSSRLDTTGSWLVTAIPRGWLLLGIACIAPSLTAGHTLSSETAVLLGGVLLAFSAFQRLVASFTDIAGAIAGYQRIKSLFEASRRLETAGATPPTHKEGRKGQLLLEADRLTYRYDGQATPALQNCSLAVRRGEKILLEGSSGGGKTTLASLLSGLRKPESGLLLINGFDRHTLGESAWRKQIAAAPQFHENHIITETLAFNLLMGRKWPPAHEDLEQAEQLCHELGLGDLIARMPSGLMQMVGEGGWQLSHGERSRIYLIRALLQESDLVILDESFAALDPQTLQLALETTLRRSETLLVIAHP